jgi:hypothetical protein
MAINTLVTIKDAIQAFVDGHDQLKRVIFEADDQRANYITEGNEFPVMFVAPIDVDVTRAMNVHTLRVYVYERINDDRLDVWENANDTSLILRDLRVWWNGYNEDSDIEIVEDPTGTFASDRELDKLVGYYSDIDFQIPSHGRCEVPVNVTPSPPTTCPVASYIVEYTDGTPIESGTIPSGGTKTVTVPNCPTCDDATWTLKDESGTTISTGTIASGGTANITAPSANIQNSDGTYNVDVVSDGSLVLPNPDVIINGNNEGSIVSITDVDIDVTTGGLPTTPDSITITGNTVAIDLAAPVASVVGAKILKTNQTIVFATGDDGDFQEGRAVDFFTLNYTNPFSNTNRFTDELGGQTYANDIVIDWSTYDGVEVLGYYRIKQGANVWSDAVANALALSISTFTSGWRLTNFKELLNLYRIGDRAMNYSPINQGAGNTRYWTSTTLTGYINQPYFGSNAWQGGGVSATNPYEWLGCRNFTVTGTTLT